MKFSLVHDSRKGGRPYNQDRVVQLRAPCAQLMAVADGMGGYAGGEFAAETAITTLANAFRHQAKPRLASPASFLADAIPEIHAAIASQGAKRGLQEARTTLVACVVQDGCAYWTHIGDSRFYLIRAGRIFARTKDHSVVQELIDAGRMREESVAAHPERNKLLRCLGGRAVPAASPTAVTPLAKNDVLLLCTDGLWGPLTPQRLLAGFIGKELPRAMTDLVALAEQRAGVDCDNISAIAMHWQTPAVVEYELAAAR